MAIKLTNLASQAPSVHLSLLEQVGCPEYLSTYKRLAWLVRMHPMLIDCLAVLLMAVSEPG